MRKLHEINHRPTRTFILIGLFFLIAIGIFDPPAARADGGGFPTLTPTVTRTASPSLTPTLATTATFTSLPPYPAESSGGSQPIQQQVASSPTAQPAAQTSNDNSSLGSCLPSGLIILLAGILLITFFFTKRTRKIPG